MVGDETTNSTNSVYVNSILMLELIYQLEISIINPNVEYDLLTILDRMESLNLNFFNI